MTDATTPVPGQPSLAESWARREENALCEQFALREGDRLLRLGDVAGANALHRLAALIRIRRQNILDPF